MIEPTDQSRILQIIPAPANMWAQHCGNETPSDQSNLGFGFLVHHERVTHMALIEDGTYHNSNRPYRYVEIRSADDIALDNTESNPLFGPCDQADSTTSICEGHFIPVDQPEYEAERKKARRIGAEISAERRAAKGASRA